MTFSLNPSLIRNLRLRLFAGFRCLVLPLVGLVFPFAGRLPVGAGRLPLEGGIGFPLGAALRLLEGGMGLPLAAGLLLGRDGGLPLVGAGRFEGCLLFKSDASDAPSRVASCASHFLF